MKKVITIMGLFGLIFVQAQVGINKDKPDATLDIVAEKTDGSQVEGLLVPRISKEAAYNMATATTQLQESNLVYVDNLSATFTAPTGDTTVTDITEKGYYFWNGAKWERITSRSSAEWVYDPATKQINLKRSGTAPFANKVLFNEKGNYVNYGIETSPTSYWDYATDAVVTNPLFDPAHVKAPIYNRRLSSALEDVSTGSTEYKYIAGNTLIVDNAPIKLKSVYTSFFGEISTSTSNNLDYYQLVGSTSSASHNGIGDVPYLIGQSNQSRLNRGTSSDYVLGTRSTAQVHNSGNAKALYSSGAFTVVGKASNVTNVSDFHGHTSYGFNTSATVTNAYNLNLWQRVDAGASPKITNAAALYYRGLTGNIKGIGGNTTGATITNNYGILLEDIVGGSASNYAIFTKKGKVHFGDDLDIENAKLVLSGGYTGENIIRFIDNSPSSGGGIQGNTWEFYPTKNSFQLYNRTTSQAVLSVSNDGKIGVGTTSPTEKLHVVGKIKATGFMVGSTNLSVPDYVFQKYYTGVSDLNSAYEFKTLSQVEDFVKTKGHLPGYLSAKEVKEQGSLDMTKTQLINIEKIEELYLHTIEQEKKIEEQQGEINELKELVKQLINQKK